MTRELTLSRTEMIKKVKTVMKEKTLDNLTTTELEQLTKGVLFDNLKKQLSQEVAKSNVVLDQIIEKWLAMKGRKSKSTQNSYSKALCVFFEWLNVLGLDIYKIDALGADSFVAYLIKQGYGVATVRNRVAAVSSFFAYLVRADILPKNYFKGCELPQLKKRFKSAEEIPTEEDYCKMVQLLRKDLNATGRGGLGKRNQAKKMILVLAILKNHGLRLSGIVNLEICGQHFQTESKGKTHQGKISVEVMNIINEFHFDPVKPFQGVRAGTIQKSFESIGQRLQIQKELKTIYSCHDFRNYAAIRRFQKTKNIIDVQRFLGHTSIDMTMRYLNSLRLDLDEGLMEGLMDE